MRMIGRASRLRVHSIDTSPLRTQNIRAVVAG